MVSLDVSHNGEFGRQSVTHRRRNILLRIWGKTHTDAECIAVSLHVGHLHVGGGRFCQGFEQALMLFESGKCQDYVPRMF